MNIVGSSCVASFITTEHLHEQLSNPFAWSIIDYNSMKYLIQNYHAINFYNINLVKDANWNFSIIIDSHVVVQYVHYKFDRAADKPYTVGKSIYSNNIWEYIIEKYFLRVNRMLKNAEEPVFVIADLLATRAGNYTATQMLELNKLSNRILFAGKYDTIHLANYHKTELAYR